MDLALAILLGIAVVWAIFVLPIMVALLAALLTPIAVLVAVTLVIWFVLKVLRDEDNSDGPPGSGKGPDP